MATKVFFYTLRPYDELGIAQRLAPQLDVEFGSTQEYPTLENAELAKGYDAVSVTPCDMSAPMVKRFHELGVKSICCRSIGYDHVDRETARELGMKVANVDYPPNGVANFAIMLMLMSLRKAGHILKRGEAQDYSLQGKIGRDISTCTVGVIGTGRIGRTVLQHLSGFGCRLLAYDLYPNDEVKKIAPKSAAAAAVPFFRRRASARSRPPKASPAPTQTDALITTTFTASISRRWRNPPAATCRRPLARKS